MPLRHAIPLVLAAAVLAACTERLRADVPAECVSEARADSPRPHHAVRLDTVRSFGADELVESEPPYRAWLSWDECAVHVAIDGPALRAPGTCADTVRTFELAALEGTPRSTAMEPAAAPPRAGPPAPPDRLAGTDRHRAGDGDGGSDSLRVDASDCPSPLQGGSMDRYVLLYLDTDPLGDDGSVYARDLAMSPPDLPFHADYLVEVRTDGRMEDDGDSLRFRGNAQLYHRGAKWDAALVRHWEAQGDGALGVAVSPSLGYLQIAISRRDLGDPCALKVTGWIVDRALRHRWAFLPPAGRPLPDSLRSYLGFQLLDGQRPADVANFNRTAYHDVGECAGTLGT